MHLLCGSNGQSLVEFALVVPLLLLLLIGAIEIGRAAYYSIAVTNAARSAVQYGAQSPVFAADSNIDNIVNAARADAPFLNPADITINNDIYECPDGSAAASPPGPTDCGGGRFIPYLKVNTQMQLALLVGLPGLPQSFPLKGEAIMRIGQ